MCISVEDRKSGDNIIFNLIKLRKTEKIKTTIMAALDTKTLLFETKNLFVPPLDEIKEGKKQFIMKIIIILTKIFLSLHSTLKRAYKQFSRCNC